jgi:3-dehydroquinate dehydratase-2
VRVAVLNGVNLDVLERRDPSLYGGLSLNQLETRIYEWAKQLELSADCRQTNSEAEYVGWCHDAYDWAGGVIVNPGAWSHYSYAIRDALELFTVPVVEVHLSNIAEREDWRQHSVVSDIVTCTVMGRGPEGYHDALQYLAVQRA